MLIIADIHVVAAATAKRAAVVSEVKRSEAKV
jgi:hypothetical protein